MKKMLLLALLTIFYFGNSLFADNVVGFWKTVDEKTQQPQSILAVYKYNGKIYGRLIATYDDKGNIQDTIYEPKKRAPGVKGNPFYSGLDILWNLHHQGSKYKDGKILDPERGNIYDSEMWTDNGNLIVRGEFLFIGRNQTWPPAKDSDFPPNFKKPDLNTLVPVIPEVK